MSKITHSLEQGSDAWHAYRAEHFGASEAAAMLGISKYSSRSDLIKRKATGIEPDVSPALQAVFDRGHATEIGGRAMAEKIIGQELYPATMSDGKLSASCDGLTMLEDIAFEHKQHNAVLADSIRAGVLPPEHQPQCQQVMMVTGAEKLLFMVSDGTPHNCAWMWVWPDVKWRTEIVQGWTQFAIDLENYQHTEAVAAPVAATIEALPALFVQVEGKVLATNLDAFKLSAQTFIDNIKTELVNDQDFADADKMVKFLKDGEERLALAKSQALAQTASIDELFRTVDAISEQMRVKRLALDKLVKAEKDNRRAEIVCNASLEMNRHVAKLNERIGGQWMPVANFVPFAEAVKGLKSLDSMTDKVAGALANEKIAANEIADTIEANIKAITVDGANFNYLVHDFAQICTKAPGDFAAIMAQRIAAHKAAEAEKDERDRKAAEAKTAAAVAAAVEAERMAEAKRVAESAQHEAAKPTANNQTQFTAPDVKRAAVVEAQDDIAAFMNSREWGKEAGKIRAVLVEFEAFKAGRRLAVAA